VKSSLGSSISFTQLDSSGAEKVRAGLVRSFDFRCAGKVVSGRDSSRSVEKCGGGYGKWRTPKGRKRIENAPAKDDQSAKYNCGPSNLLWPLLLMPGALVHNGRLEASPEIVGQLVELLVPVDLNGLPCRVADHIAVVAPCEVIIKLGFRLRINYAVEVVG
jgi:hypothetical protein